MIQIERVTFVNRRVPSGGGDTFVETAEDQLNQHLAENPSIVAVQQLHELFKTGEDAVAGRITAVTYLLTHKK